MKVLFYSNNCPHCKKLYKIMKNKNIDTLFKKVCIDNNPIPDNIERVPTILDTNANSLIMGKQVFEYILNLQYFNRKTNNINNWINNIIPRPNITNDQKAYDILLMKNSHKNI